jgi:Trk K+ transport system NAD-binding subunit
VGIHRAALVVTTANDYKNTNVAFTLRAISREVSILATAKDEASKDILMRAGASHVLRLEEMIGQAFSRRTLGGDALAHLIGRFDKLLIAEANAHRTPLVGKMLSESGLREHAGINVVGVWERGTFGQPMPETVITDNTILVLAGDAEAVHRYNELFCIYNVSADPVLILGGGRVGRATAKSLAARDVDFRIVEQMPERVFEVDRTIIGNAAELGVLEKAGINQAPTVLVTTHDDDLNIYLTLYCRSLRPDIQIISRATLEQNVPTLHRAGADVVMSYAGTGASTIMNWLQRHKIIMVAEGLDLFRVPVPSGLVNKTLIQSGIREDTGCTVVAVSTATGMEVAPEPTFVLLESADLLMIGTAEAEERFLKLWGDRRRDPKST